MIRTTACDVLGIESPVVMAPMGDATDGKAVAAVSEAGGLGILSCTWRSIDEMVREIRVIRSITKKPFGVNFVLHLAPVETVDACLAEGVPVLSSFRGEPAGFVKKAHDAGAKVVHQVTTVAEAQQAAAVGVDVIIAQGREAGGHMGPLPLWSLLPDVVEAVGDHPVLAAGGIIDGRGLAAALSFGAAGVVMGTRFLATPEATTSADHKKAILASGHGDTIDSAIWDMLWGQEWPGVKVRAFRNMTTARWLGHEDELARSITDVRAELQAALDTKDPTRGPMLAGEGAARISSLLPAAQVVRDTVAEAEQIIRRLSGVIG